MTKKVILPLTACRTKMNQAKGTIELEIDGRYAPLVADAMQGFERDAEPCTPARMTLNPTFDLEACPRNQFLSRDPLSKSWAHKMMEEYCKKDVEELKQRILFGDWARNPWECEPLMHNTGAKSDAKVLDLEALEEARRQIEEAAAIMPLSDECKRTMEQRILMEQKQTLTGRIVHEGFAKGVHIHQMIARMHRPVTAKGIVELDDTNKALNALLGKPPK